MKKQTKYFFIVQCMLLLSAIFIIPTIISSGKEGSDIKRDMGQNANICLFPLKV